MPSRSDVRSTHVWRGTLAAALLNAFGSPLDLVVGRGIAELPWWPAVLSSAVGLTMAGVLLTRRGALGVRLGSLLFIVNNTAVVLAFWVTSAHHAAAGNQFALFQGNKLGALVAALLAPGLWAGIVGIASLIGTALIKLYALHPSPPLLEAETWVLLVFGVFGLVLLGYRLRGQAKEKQSLDARAAAEAVAITARTFLAVRDLANTPLQTIEFTNALLRTRNPELLPLLDRIQRSLEKLRQLNSMLQQYEPKIEWKSGEESFDSVARLEP